MSTEKSAILLERDDVKMKLLLKREDVAMETEWFPAFIHAGPNLLVFEQGLTQVYLHTNFAGKSRLDRFTRHTFFIFRPSSTEQSRHIVGSHGISRHVAGSKYMSFLRYIKPCALPRLRNQYTDSITFNSPPQQDIIQLFMYMSYVMPRRQLSNIWRYF